MIDDESPNNPERRRFLFGPAAAIRDAIQEATTNREKVTPWVVEKLGESAVLLTLMLAGQKVTELNISRYVVKSESRLAKLDKFKEMQVETAQLWQSIYNLLVKVTELNDRWRDDYYKSETTCKTVIDSEGNETEECETNHYWDEPDGADGFYSTLSSWQDSLGHVNRQLATLTHDASSTFDLTRGPNSLYFQQESSHPSAWPITIAGLSFVIYEEVLHYFSDKRPDYLGGFDANLRVGRRTIFKMISSGAIYMGLRKFVGNKNAGNLQIMDEVKTKITDHVFTNIDIPKSANFDRCFGMTPLQLLEFVQSIENEIVQKMFLLEQRNWLGTPKMIIATQDAFLELKHQVPSVYAELVNFFGNNPSQPNVPDSLHKLSTNAWATNEILDITRKANLEQGLNGIFPYLLTFGFLAGMGFLIEFMLPTTDALVESD